MNATRELFPLVSVDIALFSVDQSMLQVLLVKRAEEPAAKQWALPGGILKPHLDDSLEAAARRVLAHKVSVELPLVEEVCTFSGPDRDPRGWSLSVLFYSLLRPKRAVGVFRQLRELSRRVGLPVAVLTPQAGNVPKCDELVNVLEAGPEEFLSLVKYAEGVVTDSYHGTLFSINFHKPFWVYTEGTKEHELGTRRGQILQEVQFADRIITDFSEVDCTDTSQTIDFCNADIALDIMRSRSKRYLHDALS